MPFIRPSKLSGDYVETMPVIEHALRWFDEQGQHIENVCCLYATAPFVQARWIQDAYIQLEKFQADGYCFSATSFAFPIQRAIKVDKEGHVNMFYPENFSTRSQDVEEAYHDAGQFYWGKASAFKQQKPFFSKDSVAYILPRHIVQDIDTQEEWYRAELMYKTILKEDI